MSGLRRRLLVAAVVFGLLGIIAFAVLSASTYSAIADIPDFDPVTGEVIRSSRTALTEVLTAAAPVLGVVSIALCVLCSAGVVASLVTDAAIDRLHVTRVAPVNGADGLSDPEVLEA